MADLEKSAAAFRTISEVAEDLGVPQHVLRFWESKFSAVRPMKRGGNRRYYRPDDLHLLRVINHLLYTEGYTIRGVQKRLREEGPRQLISQYSRIANSEGMDAGIENPAPAHQAPITMPMPVAPPEVEETQQHFDPVPAPPQMAARPAAPEVDAAALLAELRKMRADIQAVIAKTA